MVGAQSEVLLGVSDFLVEIGVLFEEAVHFLFQDCVFLVVGGNLVFVLIELLHNFGVLVG